MRKLVGTLTQRYQVTLPAAVRRHLGVSVADKVVFVIDDDGEVRLDRAEFDVDTAFASVKPLGEPLEVEEQIRLARDEKVRREYGGGQ